MHVYIFRMFTAFHLFPGVVDMNWRKRRYSLFLKLTLKKLKLKMWVEEKESISCF